MDKAMIAIGAVLVSQIIIVALEKLTGVGASLVERCIASAMLAATITMIATVSLETCRYKRK